MDFLNKAFAQVADLFHSMTPGSRITAALLIVVVVSSLTYLFAYRSTSPDVYLMNGESFRPSDLPAMEAAFAQAKLNAYQFEGSRIRVPHGQQNAYMAALAEHNALPQDYSQIMDNTLKGISPWSSKTQQEQVIKDAKRRMIEAIIREMKGINNAFVLYDIERTGGLNRETLRTASVNVSTKGGERLDDARVRAIRTLVARAFVGLSPDNIAVTDLTNSITFAGTGADGTTGADSDPYVSRKQLYEQQWRDKILRALSYVQGATVVANVELDRERSRRKETTQHDPKVVALQVTEQNKTSSTESGGPAGRPGFTSQQPNGQLSLSGGAGKGNHQEQEESKTETVNVVSTVRETSDELGLTPKRVTTAIGVPTSYFQKVWQERNPTAPGTAPKTPDPQALEQIRTEEIKKIRDHVAKLLPSVQGVNDLGELVQVTSFQDITTPEVPPPGMGENIQGWFLENWTTVGLILLALVGLSMLRSVVRATPAAAPRLASATVAHAAEPNREGGTTAGEEPNPPGRLHRFTGSGISLRDELSELVQEDPDAAANVLRAWIGSPNVSKA
jgi:flagellar M-ring protein FliF